MNRNDQGKGGKEPQSYGSQEEWLRGRTGQTVDETPHKTERHDESFYADRHETEASPAPRGGLTPDDQRREGDSHDDAKTEVVKATSHNVTEDSDERKSYFKARDY